MEKDQSHDHKQDDEDSAILAFSNTLPGNDDEPKTVETDVKALEAEKQAKEELAALNQNDATSAFGDLVQAQQIQEKVMENEKKEEAKDEDTRTAAQIEEDFKKATEGNAPSAAVKKAAPSPPAPKAAAKKTVAPAKKAPAPSKAPAKKEAPKPAPAKQAAKPAPAKKAGGSAADLARAQLAAEGGASSSSDSKEDSAAAMEAYSKSVAEAANIVDGGKEEPVDENNLDFVQLDSKINYEPIMIAQTGSKDLTKQASKNQNQVEISSILQQLQGLHLTPEQMQYLG